MFYFFSIFLIKLIYESKVINIISSLLEASFIVGLQIFFKNIESFLLNNLEIVIFKRLKAESQAGY